MRFGPSRLRRRRGDLISLASHRLLLMVPLVALLSAGVFALAAFSPFDPLAGYLGTNYTTTGAAQRAEMAAALGLDVPWWHAWWQWATGLTHGDLGFSRIYSQPVAQVLADRLPWTLLLSGIGVSLGTVLALALGVHAGLRPGSVSDRLATWFAVLLQAVPPYVLALGGIAVFALGLRVLPVGGAAAPGSDITAASLTRHLVLPATVLALSVVPWMLLSVRASVAAAVRSEPVTLALARGLPTRTIVTGHVLPVSLAPLVTLIGVRLPELVVGAVLVEEVFAWPGVAAATVAAAKDLDFALLAALSVGTTVFVLIGSLIADAVYLVLDPRVEL